MFKLDNLLLNFIKNLVADPSIQLATLVGIWIIAEAAFPSKKVKQ
jgi:hypothetical protein